MLNLVLGEIDQLSDLPSQSSAQRLCHQLSRTEKELLSEVHTDGEEEGLAGIMTWMG